jgi:hypothetical protein
VTHTQFGDLYQSVNQLDEVSKHYETVVNVRPLFIDIRTKFAESLIDVGDLGQAKIEFEIIPESRPAFAGVRL